MVRDRPYFLVAFETTKAADHAAILEELERLEAARILTNVYLIPHTNQDLEKIIFDLQIRVGDLGACRLIVVDVRPNGFRINPPRG